MKHELNNLTVLNEIKQKKHLTPWGKDTGKCGVAIMGKYVRRGNSRHEKMAKFPESYQVLCSMISF